MVQERYLVKSFGDNIDGVRIGLMKTLQLLDKYQSAVIVVPNLGQVKDTMLADVLGQDLSKQLIRNREIPFGNGKKIHLCGQLTLKNYRGHDVYLDLWGSEFSIKDVEAIPSCKAIVMVTWLPEDSAEWVKEHTVDVIYDDKQSGALR